MLNRCLIFMLFFIISFKQIHASDPINHSYPLVGNKRPYDGPDPDPTQWSRTIKTVTVKDLYLSCINNSSNEYELRTCLFDISNKYKSLETNLAQTLVDALNESPQFNLINPIYKDDPFYMVPLELLKNYSKETITYTLPTQAALERLSEKLKNFSNYYKMIKPVQAHSSVLHYLLLKYYPVLNENQLDEIFNNTSLLNQSFSIIIDVKIIFPVVCNLLGSVFILNNNFRLSPTYRYIKTLNIKNEFYSLNSTYPLSQNFNQAKADHEAYLKETSGIENNNNDVSNHQSVVDYSNPQISANDEEYLNQTSFIENNHNDNLNFSLFTDYNYLQRSANYDPYFNETIFQQYDNNDYLDNINFANYSNYQTPNTQYQPTFNFDNFTDTYDQQCNTSYDQYENISNDMDITHNQTHISNENNNLINGQNLNNLPLPNSPIIFSYNLPTDTYITHTHEEYRKNKDINKIIVSNKYLAKENQRNAPITLKTNDHDYDNDPRNFKKLEFYNIKPQSKKRKICMYHIELPHLTGYYYWLCENDEEELPLTRALARLTFINATRTSINLAKETSAEDAGKEQDNSNVPQEKDEGRTVLMVSEQRETLIDPEFWVDHNQDFFIINSINHVNGSVEPEHLNLVTTKRLASLILAAHYTPNIPIVMLDDNIKSIDVHTDFLQDNDLSWKTVIEFIKNKYMQGEKQKTIVSLNCQREYIKTTINSKKTSNFGSKVLFINLPLILNELKKSGLDLRYLLPLKLDIWGEDVYFYFFVQELGLKNHKIERYIVGFYRNKKSSNICAKTITTAEGWLDQQDNDNVPDIVNKTTKLVQKVVRNTAAKNHRFNNNLKKTNLGKKAARYFFPKISQIKPETLNNPDISNLLFYHINNNQMGFLRDYQIEATKNWLHYFNNYKSGYFNMATGTGKTVVMDNIFYLLMRTDFKKNIVVVLPDINLVNQTYNSVVNYTDKLSNLHIDIEKIIPVSSGGFYKYKNLLNNLSVLEGGKLLLICKNTFKKLVKNQEFLDSVGALIVDEAHLLPKSILNMKEGNIPIWGFTATPNEKTESLFKEQIFSYNVEQAVREKHLVPWLLGNIDSRYFNSSHKKNPELYAQGLVNFINESAKETKKMDPQNRDFSKMKGIIYAPNIKIANKFAAMLSSMDDYKKSVAINHLISANEKEDILRKFELPLDNEDAINLLITVNMFEIGSDFPFLDYIIYARPTTNLTKLIQARGRALRLSPETNKELAHFIILEEVYNEQVDNDKKIKDLLKYSGQQDLLKKIHDDKKKAQLEENRRLSN